jgi:uncharacterized protein (TIGR02996 family)
MTPLFPGFVKKIHENPKDELPYLALSDHLEEEGHRKEADLIRFVVHHGGAKGAMADALASAPGGMPTTSGGTPIERPGVVIRNRYHLHLASDKHLIGLPHADPTFKLVREYRLARKSLGPAPVSLHEAKKAGKEEAWREAHKALSQIAFHHTHFGTSHVGERMSRLLGKRGAFKPSYEDRGVLRYLNRPRPDGTHRRTRDLNQEYETMPVGGGTSPTAGGVSFGRRMRRLIAVAQKSPSAPVRLARPSPLPPRTSIKYRHYPANGSHVIQIGTTEPAGTGQPDPVQVFQSWRQNGDGRITHLDTRGNVHDLGVHGRIQPFEGFSTHDSWPALLHWLSEAHGMRLGWHDERHLEEFHRQKSEDEGDPVYVHQWRGDNAANGPHTVTDYHHFPSKLRVMVRHHGDFHRVWLQHDGGGPMVDVYAAKPPADPEGNTARVVDPHLHALLNQEEKDPGFPVFLDYVLEDNKPQLEPLRAAIERHFPFGTETRLGKKKEKPEKLARPVAAQDWYGGWMTPEGVFHHNDGNLGHDTTAAKHFGSLDTAYEDAYSAGWGHMGHDNGPDAYLQTHGAPSEEQVRQARVLAKRLGFSFLHLENSKAGIARPVRLARP